MIDLGVDMGWQLCLLRACTDGNNCFNVRDIGCKLYESIVVFIDAAFTG